MKNPTQAIILAILAAAAAVVGAICYQTHQANRREEARLQREAAKARATAEAIRKVQAEQALAELKRAQDEAETRERILANKDYQAAQARLHELYKEVDRLKERDKLAK